MADLTLVTLEGRIDLSRPVASDLSAKQYHFVKHDTSEKMVICGNNDKTLGVLQDKPNGSSIETTGVARVSGLSKLKISETVVFGNYLTPTAAGLGEVCDAAGENYGAYALGSGEANDLIACLVVKGEVEASDA